MSGVVSTPGAGGGANQLSFVVEFAIFALAALPYDCQPRVAQTPMETRIRKRARLRNARLTSDDFMTTASRVGRVVGSAVCLVVPRF
jgi:hypothetical protein